MRDEDEFNNKNPTLNLLDRTIAYFAPKAGFERMRWRSGMAGYSAARPNRRNAGWIPAEGQGEMINRQARRMLRAKAQDLERNSEVAGAIIEALNRNVVGRGFELQATTDNEDFNKKVEMLWKEWCKARNCDITGQQSFRELTTMFLDRTWFDGETLAIKTYTGNGKFPFQLQMREAADLDALGLFANQKNGNVICDGVELNQYSKPVAYYLTETDPLGMIKPEAKRIESNRVIYGWRRKRPSEYRGITKFSRIIERINDLGEYITAVAFMQKILASLCVFIKQTLPNGTSSLGRLSNSLKSPEGNKLKRLKPGSIEYLDPGEEAQTLNPSGNSAEAAAFATMQGRMSAAGVGLSLEATARDVSQVNYSSARQNLLEDQKTYEDWQLWLKEHFLDEVYSEFIISAYLANQFPEIPDFWENKEYYLKHKFIPQGMSWIDPVKEATANKIALDSGQTTLQDICARAGKDWKEVLEQRAVEIETMNKLGIKPAEGSKSNANQGTDGTPPQTE